jgi:hypothetical protein
LCDGGDWFDASAELLSVPCEVDIDAEMGRHRQWYDEEYLPAMRRGEKIPYESIGDWLQKRCNAKPDTSIEEVWVR